MLSICASAYCCEVIRVKKLFRYALLLIVFLLLVSSLTNCDIALDREPRSDVYFSYSLRDASTGVLRIGERSFTVNHALLSGVGATLKTLYAEASRVLSPLAEKAFSFTFDAFSSLWDGENTSQKS